MWPKILRTALLLTLFVLVQCGYLLASNSDYVMYRVKRGDTLWSISERFFGSAYYWYFIWEANKSSVPNPHWIYPSQLLRIPSKKLIGLKKQIKPEVAEVKRPIFPLKAEFYIEYAGYKVSILGKVFVNDRTIVGTGDNFVVESGGASFIEGNSYVVVRKVACIDEKVPIYKNIAIALCKKVVGDRALFEIADSVDAVQSGDSIIELRLPEPVYKLNKVYKVKAKVIYISDGKGRALSGDSIIVSVDGGTLEVGDLVYKYDRWGRVTGSFVAVFVTGRYATLLPVSMRQEITLGDILEGVK